MTNLAAALAVLFLTHLLPTLPSVRPRLVRAVGLTTFRIVYSLVSAAILIWLVLAYRNAADSPWLWTPPFWARWAAVASMPLAIWLVCIRLMRRPTVPRRGIYDLVPAPGSTGLTLWALLHLLNVGQARAVMTFGVFFAMCLAVAVKNTVAAMSIPAAPFALEDIGWRPIAAAFLVWAALLTAHPHVIGVDPLLGIIR